MVRFLAVFAFLLATPALAEDGTTRHAKPPHGASARAEATVTIMRGEHIDLKRRQDARTTPSDRQEQRLTNNQIRIDFY